MSQQKIEVKKNWQASFRSSSGVICLMRTIKNGFYWEYADYTGLFPWGATAEFTIGSFRFDLARNKLELINGVIPPELLIN